jgi:hypothetical protein
MNEQVIINQQVIIAAVGLALLLLLCLPIAGLQKLVLEVFTWALRLALIAALAGGAYLIYQPAALPPEVVAWLNDVPRLKALLPDPSTQLFGPCAAAAVVAPCIPLLAVLDVCRKLAGRRLRRLRALTAPNATPVTPDAAAQADPAARRVDRRAAADAMMQAGYRPPGDAGRRGR